MNTTPIPAAGEAIIVRRDSIATITQAGPESYRTNSISCQRCTDAGQMLLDEAIRSGMNDDLDRRIAAYIEKARKTLRVMNERRAPVTKLFDQVRSEFTALENAIDPAKGGTVPYQLAQQRNAYAARKHEEAERRRRAELAAQELARGRESYRADVAQALRNAFNATVNDAVGKFVYLNKNVTLKNFQSVVDTLSAYPASLPADWDPAVAVRKPVNLPDDEALRIRQEIVSSLLPEFDERYVYEVDEVRRGILEQLPSKRAELEEIARADAAEAERRQAEIAARDAAEAARLEQERRRAEDDARRRAELDKANAEVGGLFSAAKAEQAYAPKTKVSKKIRVSDQSGFLAILALWWKHEGASLSVEELSKIFKKQISFCEKIATKDGIFAESPALEYVDDVKAQ